MTVLNCLLIKSTPTQIPSYVKATTRFQIVKTKWHNYNIQKVGCDFISAKQDFLAPTNVVKLFSRSIHLTPLIGVNRSRDRRRPKRTPYFAQVYRNTFNWLRNKIDFWVLRFAWDPTFEEKEFKRGAKQAIVTVSQSISKKDLRSLHGLVTSSGMSSIDKEIHYRFPPQHLHLLSIDTVDVKLVLPIKIYFLSSRGKKSCNIDILFVALRRLEDIYSSKAFKNGEIYDEPAREANTKHSVEDVLPKENPRDHVFAFRSSLNTENAEDENKFIFNSDPKESLKYGFPVLQKMVPGSQKDILFTEMFARFNRNYSSLTDNNWTISYFKVTHIELLKEKVRIMS